MFLNAALLIIIGIFCLVGAIVAIIFTIISFAGNKAHKYSWLTAFFVLLAGLIFCIFVFIRKAVHKVEHFTEQLNERMTESLKSYSDSVSYSNVASLQNNEHIKQLKSYTKDSSAVPDQFYYYLGYETYYRLPLVYPYSIHCYTFKEDGELFNEINVKRFDENDNGEQTTFIEKIDKIAFDENYLLIDQKVSSTRSPDYIHHYFLYSFKTREKEEAGSEKELFNLADKKGYKGKNKLQTLEEYSRLFDATY